MANVKITDLPAASTPLAGSEIFEVVQSGSSAKVAASAIANTFNSTLGVANGGTEYTNPATLPAGTDNGAAFSSTGDAIAVAHATSPYITAYPWSSSGFGAKYANLATLPTG